MDRAPPRYNENPGTPRSFHAPSMVERQSVASSTAPFSSIGASLCQPYDSDDEDGRSIRHPQSYQGGNGGRHQQGGQSVGDADANVRSGDVRAATTRNGYGMSEKVHSVEGAVGGQGRPRSIVHFPGPNIGHNQHNQASQYNHNHNPQHPQMPQHQHQQQQQQQSRPVLQQHNSGHGRPPPPPLQHQQHGHAPQYPQATHPSMRSPNPNRPQPTLSIPGSTSPALSPHFLPQPSTPISPALAAPPSATYSTSSLNDSLLPPRSAFSAGPRSSVASSSASITAYDSMEKTHSLMRGGEDEVMAPLNTRRPQRKRSMSANALGGMRRTVFGQPGGEFWKRFSVMAKLDTNKESEWMIEEQARKRRIRITAIIGVIVIALIVGGVAIGVVLSNNDSSDARPKSVEKASD